MSALSPSPGTGAPVREDAFVGPSSMSGEQSQRQTPRTALLPSVFANDEAVFDDDLITQMSSSRRQRFQPASDEPYGVAGQEDIQDDLSSQVNSFQPYFTVVEDGTTGEQHHPYVHYIFSDDDPEILTAALLNALDPITVSNAEKSPSSQPSDDHVPERFIILDMAPDGHTVVSAKSLSDEWQVLDTHISAAPTFNGAATTEEDAGLMLRIEGIDASPPSEAIEPEMMFTQRQTTLKDADLFATMQDLAEQYHSEVKILGKLAGNTSERAKDGKVS